MTTLSADQAAPIADATTSRRSGSVVRPRSSGPVAQVLRALATGLSAALLALALALACLVIVVPLAVGGQALTVLTNSMAPGMPPGTLVIVRPTPIEEIRIGDVVTYQIRSGDPAVVSHRVVSRTLSATGDITLVTRGDNNDVDDAAPVTAPQIRGTVWYSLPLLGWVNSALSGSARGWMVPAIAAVCFGYAAWAFTSWRLGRRRRSAGPRGRHAASTPTTTSASTTKETAP